MGELINLNTSTPSSVKTKVITGTTSSQQGSGINIAHGLDFAKIRGFRVMVVQGNGALVLPNNQNGVGTGNRFDAAIIGANLNVVNVADQSISILSKPITAIIEYV